MTSAREYSGIAHRADGRVDAARSRRGCAPPSNEFERRSVVSWIGAELLAFRHMIWGPIAEATPTAPQTTSRLPRCRLVTHSVTLPETSSGHLPDCNKVRDAFILLMMANELPDFNLGNPRLRPTLFDRGANHMVEEGRFHERAYVE